VPLLTKRETDGFVEPLGGFEVPRTQHDEVEKRLSHSLIVARTRREGTADPSVSREEQRAQRRLRVLAVRAGTGGECPGNGGSGTPARFAGADLPLRFRIVRDSDHCVRSSGCLWKSFVAAVVLAVALVAATVALDSASRSLSADVCERSEVDLVRLAGRGDLDGVRSELQTVDPNQQDQNENTALGCAIPRRRSEVMNELLARGADPNKPSGAFSSRQLPLELAYERSDEATLTALLEHRADPTGTCMLTASSLGRSATTTRPLSTRLSHTTSTSTASPMLDRSLLPQDRQPAAPSSPS
jgi:hypothetical protein